jgi:hypothetical protein
MLRCVEATRSLELAAAAKSLGLACPAPQSLPTLLTLLERCGDDFEMALIENANAGGDNASRGLALGMVLGAMHGKSRIPERWLRGLRAAPRPHAFLHGLPPSRPHKRYFAEGFAKRGGHGKQLGVMNNHAPRESNRTFQEIKAMMAEDADFCARWCAQSSKSF